MNIKGYVVLLAALAIMLGPAGAGAFDWRDLDPANEDSPLRQNLGRLDAGQWGYKTFPLLAEEMWAKNVERGRKTPKPLTDWQKKYLSPWFAIWNLQPEAVRIVYQAELLSNYRIMDRWPITIMDEYAGQTFDDLIYLAQAYKERSGNLLILLSHEAYHVKQYKELGSIAEFGRQYTIGFVEALFSYENNPFEKQAFAAEARFKKWLCDQKGWRCK